MSITDKTLTCRDCHQDFVFTSGEQEFFAIRGLTNLPKRCPNCRVDQRLKREGKDLSQCTEVPCEECGAVARVPFKPNGSRPVYCSSCMAQRKQAGTG